MDEQRRVFLFRSAGAAVAGSAAGLAQAQVQGPRRGLQGAGPPTLRSAAERSYLFFTVAEAAFVEAAVDRLIPSDASGPGARKAGVAQFIDRQLAGAWGAGERLYRSGPWQAGAPTQGYQLPFTPAELFRNALGELLRQWRAGAPFHLRPAAEQDEILRVLQTDKRDLSGVPSHVFFESLWALTLEGFFGDPVHGRNRNAVGWRLLGFPGGVCQLLPRGRSPRPGLCA